MKIVKPSAKLIDNINATEIYAKIERCGRVCYQSEPKGKPEEFIRMLIKRGHESVLEHVSLTFNVVSSRGVMDEFTRHRLASFCVTGDTVIPSYSDSARFTGKKRTIEEIYNWSKDAKCQAAFKALVIRSFDEETHTIIPNKIKQVFYNGIQDVFEIKTASGRAIKCTAGHRFFTAQGWKCLSDINVGDSIYSNGKELLENEDWIRHNYLTLNKTRKQVALEIGCCEATLYKAFQRFGIFKPWSDRPNSHPGHGIKGMFSMEQRKAISIRKSGKNNEGYKLDRETLSSSGGYSEAHRFFDGVEKVCENCGATESVEIHHIDKNPRHNSRDNIKFLCPKCHRLWHKPFAIGAFVDNVCSISYVGKQKVFDLEMESPYHNYIANGLIVHNSVESTRYCKYGELTFIEPIFWDKNEPSETYEVLNDDEGETAFAKRPNKYNAWLQTMEGISVVYKFLIDNGAKPEEARSVLPLCIKSEYYVTANLREWRHILKLRTSPKAHPEMRFIAGQILSTFKEKLPVIVEDIS